MDNYKKWLEEQKATQPDNTIEVAKVAEVVLLDDRISCWWCHWWDAKATCNNRPFAVNAIANGTLQRCGGYKPRSHLSLEDFGFCTICGVAVAIKEEGFAPESNSQRSRLYCRKHHPYQQRKK